MSEDTAERRAALEVLGQAIDGCRRAFADGDGTERWVATEWLVVVASQGWDEDGDQCTSLERFVGPGDPPIHRTFGLAQYAVLKIGDSLRCPHGD